MCGIFGVVGEVEQAAFQACLSTLAHRGPDGSGQWRAPGVALGHRRLSILDLSEAGRQPMRSADGRYHIVFNGEIYNFLELRAELERLGCVLRSESDTEVALAAFAQWREECLERFNGMWTLAIWDSTERSLFLSRDRLGKKPLFHAQIEGMGFVFASEMKAILPLLHAPRANQRLFRDRSSIFTYEATEECLVEGIRRFPAGSCGWFRDGRLATRRWWSTLDRLVDVPERYEEQVELVRETFLDACRLRMRSDVPIGTALSGGLDSSATITGVAHIAASRGLERTQGGWQHAFVASFPGTPLDEARYAARVCEHIGIQPRVIEVNPARAVDRLLDYFYLFEERYISSPIPFMLTYEAVKAAGISVTLDGHGADELFGGYAFDFLTALRDAGFDPPAARQVLAAYFDAQPRDAEQFPVPRNRLGFWLGWQAKDALKRMLRRRADPPSRDRQHPAWGGLDALTRRLYVSAHETILPTLLRNYDRYSMASGVEIRMPFLDHRLLRLAFSLPWTAKVRNGYSKAIVRDAMAPYMPAEIAYRKVKIGFNAPIVDWMRGPLRTFMLDTIASRSFRECTLLDPPGVAAAVRSVVDGPKPSFDEAQAAWIDLSAYLWEQGLLARSRTTGNGVHGASASLARA